MRLKPVIFSILLLLACSCTERSVRVEIIATNDTHGALFPRGYTEDTSVRSSLASVCTYADSLRNAVGEDHVILLDCGDHLQGDNAVYYFNYVDTVADKHLISRVFNYMKYDAAVVGNHDLEAGHPVYDRIASELECPYLAANAVDVTDGEAWFDRYAVMEKDGLRVAVIGFTNPNIKQWLAPSLWSGLRFEPILPYAQKIVDRVIGREHPDIVIAAMHTGTGDGNPANGENQALACLNTLEGVDFVFCAHDHSSRIEEGYRKTEGRDSLVSILVNAGRNAANYAINKGVNYVSNKTGSDTVKQIANVVDNMAKDTVSDVANKIQGKTNNTSNASKAGSG